MKGAEHLKMVLRVESLEELLEGSLQDPAKRKLKNDNTSRIKDANPLRNIKDPKDVKKTYDQLRKPTRTSTGEERQWSASYALRTAKAKSKEA